MPVIPTKGNLLNLKKSLSLAKMGYTLLDRKRNILIREMMGLIDDAKAIRGQIEGSYQQAYLALQNANITLGLCDNISKAIPEEDGIAITYRSVMGVEIPKVALHESAPRVYYGFQQSNSQLDSAYIHFHKVKNLTITLAEIENSVYRLANAIKKTQKRANALKNIIIPRFEADVKFITEALEEKEREEFSRLKIIKNNRSSRDAG